MDIKFTKHAKQKLYLRNINKKQVHECILKPDIILPARNGKKALLKDYGKNYLKIIILEENNAIVVITLYWLAKDRLKK